MEPTASSNGPSVEMTQQGRVESAANPDAPINKTTPERAPGGEASSTGPSNVPPPATPPADANQPQSILPVPQQTQTALTDDNPLVASDDEVLEKEWVDKAKKIVSQTKDDPYNQEKEVSKLQADYIKKRYGKEIKLTSD